MKLKEAELQETIPDVKHLPVTSLPPIGSSSTCRRLDIAWDSLQRMILLLR
jgi:hypothetical protein